MHYTLCLIGNCCRRVRTKETNKWIWKSIEFSGGKKNNIWMLYEKCLSNEKAQPMEKYLINGYYFGSHRYVNGFKTKTKLCHRNIFEFLHNTMHILRLSSGALIVAFFCLFAFLRIFMTVVYASLLIHLMLWIQMCTKFLCFSTFIDIKRIGTDPFWFLFFFFISIRRLPNSFARTKSIMFLDYSKYMGIELMKTIIIQTVFSAKMQRLSFDAESQAGDRRS